MKKIYSLLLVIAISPAAIFTIKTPNKKPIIISDYDDVWNMKRFFLNLLSYVTPSETSTKKQKTLNNLTLNILDYGRRYPSLASYIPGLIDYIGKSRYINQPIHNLYKHLKAEDYPIVIATNKDHLLYDLSIETLGNEIPSIVDTVFVAEPHSDAAAIAQLQAFADQPTTPANYKNMTHRAINIKETNNIVHVPSKKPDRAYFEYVTQRIGNDNDMIFIDDNKENVDAFNALQKDTKLLRLGIRYDESNLNQFAENLKKAGLVSENNNQELLNEIRYPGIFGKIRLYTYQTFGRAQAATN